MKHSVVPIVYHILSYTCHTCKYHTPLYKVCTFKIYPFYMKSTICNCSEFRLPWCWRKWQTWLVFFFFDSIFSLSGLTLEMMIFNSTYFSSPFHDSSLFTFPAHLNQEYLQIFFSTPYLEDQSANEKEKSILKQHNPWCPPYVKLKLAPVFDCWSP